MKISEVIEMLEKEKEKHGDIQLIQTCTHEGLSMPIIPGCELITDSENGKKALALNDGDERYFGELPPE